MTKSRRLLRILLIALALVLFTGYFAFSTFLFSPLEGRYGNDVSNLVPRGVDFFVAKARLGRDFESFPTELAVADDFRATEGGAVFLASPEYQRWRAENKLDELEQQIEDALAQVPIELDFDSLLIGRDVALAGYFKSPDFANADWAFYARTNWIGKLAVSLLEYPDLLGLDAQGLLVTEDEGITALSGGQLARPLYVTRVLDVVVVGTREELVRGALDFAAKQGEGSFGQSARYADRIDREDRAGDEIELFVDMRAMRKESGWDGRWPDASSQDLGPALAGRLFQVRALNELIGTLGFEGGLSADLFGELSSDELSGVQKRLYRKKGLDRTDVRSRLAWYAPADVGVFVTLRVDMAELLRQTLLSSEPAVRTEIDDLVRTVWSFPDAQPLIAEIAAALGDEVVFLARENDFPDEGADGPPHDDQHVLAWALVAPVESTTKVKELISKVHNYDRRFGIQGREPNSNGVFFNIIDGGHRVWEFWSPFVPGTGHISVAEVGDSFIISNHHALIGLVTKTYYEGGEKGTAYPRLMDHPSFAIRLGDALDHFHLLTWLNPRAIGDTLRAFAREKASDSIRINWDDVRPKLDQDVLSRDFGGRAESALTADERERFSDLSDREAERFEAEFRDKHLGGRVAAEARAISYLELVAGLLVELRLGTKRIEFALRAEIPLEPEAGTP